ncbi:MAG: exodeoxyribonuclease VII small subunit [Cellvibrionales bacterium]|nr:exodeoxyribonuclease VII small subunit [Cellvibrionales bacterium]
MSDSDSAAEPVAASPLEFEKHLAELEQIVAAMERGDMSLEESLQAYERGVALTRQCQAALDSAQQRIEVLATKGAPAADSEPQAGE